MCSYRLDISVSLGPHNCARFRFLVFLGINLHFPPTRKKQDTPVSLQQPCFPPPSLPSCSPSAQQPSPSMGPWKQLPSLTSSVAPLCRPPPRNSPRRSSADKQTPTTDSAATSAASHVHLPSPPSFQPPTNIPPPSSPLRLLHSRNVHVQRSAELVWVLHRHRARRLRHRNVVRGVGVD